MSRSIPFMESEPVVDPNAVCRLPTSYEGISYEKPKSVVETVVEYLRESIINGYLNPGEKIITAKITKQLGVSNIPIREAMKVLASEGLVVSSTGRSMRVAPTSRTDLDETFETREMLELFAIELFGRHYQDQASLKQKLESLCKGVVCETDCPDSCLGFHQGLINMAGNSKMKNMYKYLFNNIRRYQHISLSIQPKEENCLAEHGEILQGLVEGNLEKASSALKDHIHRKKHQLMVHLELT